MAILFSCDPLGLAEIAGVPPCDVLTGDMPLDKSTFVLCRRCARTVLPPGMMNSSAGLSHRFQSNRIDLMYRLSFVVDCWTRF